jgi:transcriptional regulator with XRE-family HTH domain
VSADIADDPDELVAEAASGEESSPTSAEALNEVISGIGTRIRRMRTRMGYSLQQLADRADVSAAGIHKIERNGMVPTITTLMKIAAALNRPVSYFIAENAVDDKPAIRTTPDNRRAVFTSISGLELKSISGPYGRFFMAGAHAEAAPGTESASKLTNHPGEELVYVLDGTLCFEFADETIKVSPGDSIHFRGDLAHRWYNSGSKPAKAVWLALRPM